MKPDYWARLTGAARRAPGEGPLEMPFGFDTRVVADLRGSGPEPDALPGVGLLRGALVCASLILLLSVVMNYQTLREREPGSVAIADSILRVSMLP
jgi:hypothetical protein